MESDRPRVFLDVSIGTEPAGRLVIELFTDKTPKTCANFLALCTANPPDPSYALSPFHRVIDDFMIQGGDTTHGDGTGGGPTFADENLLWRPLSARGLVCSANRGPDTNTSQFFITLAACPHLDGRHTVFGTLLAGDAVLARIAATRVDAATDRPTESVLIARCGRLDERRPPPRRQSASPPKVASSSPRGRARSASLPQSPPPKNARRRARTDRVDETRRGRPRSRSAEERGVKRTAAAVAEEEKVEEEVSPARKHARVRSASPSRRRDGEGALRRSRSRSPGGHGERRRGDRWNGRERRYDRDRGGGRYDARRGWETRRWEGRRREGRLDEGRLGGAGGYEAEESGIKFKGRGSMKYREPAEQRRW